MERRGSIWLRSKNAYSICIRDSMKQLLSHTSLLYFVYEEDDCFGLCALTHGMCRAVAKPLRSTSNGNRFRTCATEQECAKQKGNGNSTVAVIHSTFFRYATRGNRAHSRNCSCRKLRIHSPPNFLPKQRASDKRHTEHS